MGKQRYDVRVRIVSQQGFCPYHRVGQEWTIAGTTPEGICISALGAMMPFINVMRYTSENFLWDKQLDVTQVACGDPDNPVVFEITRLLDSAVTPKR